MDLKTFRKIILWFNNRGIYKFNLTPITGEFFNHPEAAEIVLECTEKLKDSIFHIVCNGVALYRLGLYEKIKNSSNIKIMVSLYGTNYEEFSSITNEIISREEWHDYMDFLKHYNIECLLRTIKSRDFSENFKNQMNILEIKNTYANWNPDSSQILKQKYCNLFFNITVRWDGSVVFCDCSNITTDDFLLGKFFLKNNKAKFEKSKILNDLIMQFLFRGRLSNELCSKCNVPEMITEDYINHENVNIKTIINKFRQFSKIFV